MKFFETILTQKTLSLKIKVSRTKIIVIVVLKNNFTIRKAKSQEKGGLESG